MTTNHIEQMRPGDGLYAFFLNSQGHVLADCFILCFADHFLLDTESETRQGVYQHLDRYIIADDVVIEDITDQTYSIALEGPDALRQAGEAGLAPPDRQYAHVEWGEVSLACLATAGVQGLRIYGPAERREEMLTMLETGGAVAASQQEAERARIVNLRPRYGIDMSASSLPQETNQMHAVHFSKGCYLGQEIVERIRSRGRINKVLMGFRGNGVDVPAPGAGLFSGDKEAGQVTSAARALNDEIAGLAIIRAPFNRSGEALAFGGGSVRLQEPLPC
jgi:aminomethyltransferase